MDSSIVITKITTYVLRAEVDQGPLSSLGPMPVRRGCLLRIEDAQGAYGWGEIWCNFPPRGAESRAHLIDDVISPLLLGVRFGHWTEVRPKLESQLCRMMIHTGEAGAFAHCFAGIDMAVADFSARRAGLDMTRFLGGQWRDVVPVYASTPSGGDLNERCDEIRAAGHDALKLKIGYDPHKDQAALACARRVLGSQYELMVDANQAWTPALAREQIATLAAFDLSFVEEPLLADAPLMLWQQLAQACGVPLAAGENIQGELTFASKVDARALGVVQPDVAKWGGVSGALAVGRHALAHGARCCMHFMGTGLGLAASMHVLAAIGGDGRIELDFNENPLRTQLGELDLTVVQGAVPVPTGLGFGFEPDVEALKTLSIAA